MELLLIVLLSIPFALVIIGDAVRIVLELLVTAVSQTIVYIIIHIRLPHPQHPPSPVKQKPARTLDQRAGELWRYRSFLSDLRLIRQLTFRLGKTVLHRLRAKRNRLAGRLRNIRLHVPRVSIPGRKFPALLRQQFSERIRRKRTPKQPLTVYPAPLHIAWRLQSFFAGVFLTLLFVFLPYVTYYWLWSLPNPHLLTNRDLEVSTKILDRHGNLLYEIYADQNRTPVPLNDIPKILQQATIAIEDRDFYHHQGFSIRAIFRAARETFLHDNLQGGSTITQQLIKSALLTPEVTYTRKIKEVILAFWAERMYTKNQILDMYLNQVPYGGTAWGVEAASEMYFGKDVRDITLGEAALLAGLPAAPTEYSPFGSHPEKAFIRQQEVLRRMVEDGYITKGQADEATSQRILFANRPTAIRAPHFVMYVKDLLEKKYGPRVVERGGLRVTTTLDLPMQEQIQQIVSNHVNALSGLHVGNGAVLVTNPRTGEILAMIGSKNYFDTSADGNVNLTTSLRQPGSSIKVVNYAAALENGFTAATILDDSPVAYSAPGAPVYAPVNYDGRYHGLVPLRYALANSYNIPAVKVLARIGVDTMVTKGRQMGITSWNDSQFYGLSLTLGAADVTMLDMAKVYGSLANQGNRTDLTPILEITDYTGRVLEKQDAPKTVRAVSPGVAWILSDILRDNVARTPAFGPNSSLVIPGKSVSVKTGTSNDKRDNWAIGYTPSFVVVAWVGNNDNSPMDQVLTSGVTGASPIWHDTMTYLLTGRPDETYPKPDDVIAVPCYYGRPEYFIKGTEPKNGKCSPIPTPMPSRPSH